MGTEDGHRKRDLLQCQKTVILYPFMAPFLKIIWPNVRKIKKGYVLWLKVLNEQFVLAFLSLGDASLPPQNPSSEDSEDTNDAVINE